MKISNYFVLAGLLFTMAIAGPVAAKDKSLSGRVSGHEIHTFFGGNPPAGFDVDGKGTANGTHLGGLTATWTATVPFPSLSTIVTRHFVAADGSSFSSSGPAQGTLPDANGNIDVVEEHTITSGSGTGRFAGVTGSFIVTRTVSAITGKTSGSFSGTINLRP